ncbi:MAG: LEA type 2 family protein [Wenzhouxiangellaceae bacterium]|nr:LEA type 2 family protein [Wenzhouxiangellaceae bacterium]
MKPNFATATTQISIFTLRAALVFGFIALAGACAGFGQGREPPTVSVQSFRAVPGQGSGLPTFEIGLVVLNPNPEPLRLQGVAYSVRLDGQSLLDGVSNELPVIEGYGQETVTLKAAINVLGGIRLLNSLMRSPSQTFDYEFSAKLDPAGFSRNIHLTESGRIDLTNPSN